MWIYVAPHREHTTKALGYGTRSQGISQFYLHIPRSSANGINRTRLFLPSQCWYLFADPVIMEGSFGLGSWLPAEIKMYLLQRELGRSLQIWVVIVICVERMLTLPSVIVMGFLHCTMLYSATICT